MVSTKEIQTANTALKSKSYITVFVGATSGIGLAGIESLLSSTSSSTIYIIGRSEKKFAPTLSRLQTINLSAKVVFIEAQVSLLKEVKRVCDIISSQEENIDILWLSQGGLDASKHNLTSEGLFDTFAIAYYSRLLFINLLLPLLNKSTSSPRILSILAAGQEGPITSPSDPGMSKSESYTSFWAAQKQLVTMTSLSMSFLAKQNPNVGLLHTMPGMVNTAVHDKWASTFENRILGGLVKWVMIPAMHLLSISAEQAGSFGVYEVTDQRFDAGNGKKNFWRLGENAEELKECKVLKGYEADGTRERIWRHTEDVFGKVLGGKA